MQAHNASLPDARVKVPPNQQFVYGLELIGKCLMLPFPTPGFGTNSHMGNASIPDYGGGLYKQAAEITGLAEQTLRLHASMATQFEMLMRINNLSYQNHR